MQLGLKRQLTSFAQQWDRNLHAQGFESAAAQQQARDDPQSDI
jgi:hypothetical protein